MSIFNVYLFGYLVFIIGLGLLAHLLGVGPAWIAAGFVTLVGLGVMTSVTHTKRKNTSDKV